MFVGDEIKFMCDVMAPKAHMNHKATTHKAHFTIYEIPPQFERSRVIFLPWTHGKSPVSTDGSHTHCLF